MVSLGLKMAIFRRISAWALYKRLNVIFIEFAMRIDLELLEGYFQVLSFFCWSVPLNLDF